MCFCSEVGSIYFEQHGSCEKRVDIFQQSTQSGQSDVHGDIEIAVFEKSVCVLPRSRAKGRNHSSSWNRTGDEYGSHVRYTMRIILHA